MGIGILEAERMAIIALRKRYPNEGARKLAKRIFSRQGFGHDDAALVLTIGHRPELSIYSVIRRHDAKGYYANGGEAKACKARREWADKVVGRKAVANA
jgi:hypothetical protein